MQKKCHKEGSEQFKKLGGQTKPKQPALGTMYIVGPYVSFNKKFRFKLKNTRKNEEEKCKKWNKKRSKKFEKLRLYTAINLDFLQTARRPSFT